MGSIRVREGGVTVEISDEIDRMFRDAMERLYPGMLALMEAEIAEILAVAKSEWPIKTGRSNAGLKKFVEIKDGGAELRVGIENAVPYAVYVRPRDWFGATTAWQRLVRGQIFQVNRELAAKLGPVLVKALKEASGG